MRPRRGFALLITITLLAFLVLLLVSLASLTRVETQVASNTQQIAQARQNALLALNIALGQLQKHAGHDQRVTARADVTIPSVVTINASTATSTALTAIDTHWRASRNRHWTGVWLNNNSNADAYDADNPASFNSDPRLQAWLVSGNETTPDAYNPETIISGLSASSTALDRLLDAQGRAHRLLVKASAGVTSANDLDRAVTAPEIPITANNTPGLTGPQTIGHYAWWIGDEGVKARANLVDSYAEAPSGESLTDKLVRETTRRQSAQRPAIEAMTTNGTDGMGASYPANDPGLLKILTADQIRYLNSAPPAFPVELKNRFHDQSVTSRGVLSDPRHGGLKADLSYLFGQPTLSAFRTALREHFGTNAIAPLNAAAGDLSANPLLSPTAAFRATLPSAPPGGNYTDRFINTATWEQLWSFANQGASFNTSNQAAPRLHSATQHGLYPLVIQIKTFFRLRMVGGGPDADGINRTGTFSIDTIPVVLLANPYAVPLAPADYQLRFSGSNPQLVFGNTDDTSTPDSSFATRAFTNEPTYAGNIQFVLRSTGMAAGEAQIFTIDPTGNPGLIDSEDRIVVASSTDAKQVVMKNDYDPTPALTFNTTATLPGTHTRAALRLSNGSLNVRLYLGFAAGQGERRLIQYITAQGLRDSAFSGSNQYTLVVDPMSDGIRQGGGVIAVINQPPTTDNRAAYPGSPSVFFSHQQAPFLQVNYRTMLVTWAGNSTYSHPLEWARRFVKNGSTGSPGNTPNPWLDANLLRPSGSTTTARWGIVNIGEGQNQTVPPASIGGPSASDVGFKNHLYDIPRPDQPLSSLGQLQHFNTAGYIPDTTAQATSSMNSWQTNYPISNSYPQPRVPRDRLFNYVNNTTVSLGYHFDGSSLWNDIFWDRFTVSTYPQTGDFDFATDKLVNARYRPFRDPSTVSWDDGSRFRGDGNPASAANARAAASNLLVEGAFNINSTSVEAWKALFSSLKNVPFGTELSPSAPFSRTLSPDAGSADAATGISPNSWLGFRDLSRDEIQALAEEMVMQIRKRGPFTSLAEFVNRRLIPAASDPHGLGLSGALQAALDRVVNQPSNLAPTFRVKSSATSSTSSTNVNQIAISDLGYILPSALAGFPGYVLQGDILSTLGPSLAARSDTFTIRSYGDVMNPASGATTPEARAWCEAVVQRVPDYVDPSDQPHAVPAANSTNEKFGRRFQIVSFRWLSPDDI